MTNSHEWGQLTSQTQFSSFSTSQQCLLCLGSTFYLTVVQAEILSLRRPTKRHTISIHPPPNFKTETKEFQLGPSVGLELPPGTWADASRKRKCEEEGVSSNANSGAVIQRRRRDAVRSRRDAESRCPACLSEPAIHCDYCRCKLHSPRCSLKHGICWQIIGF